jgi:hypothetical protein
MNRFLGKLTIHVSFLLEKLNKKYKINFFTRKKNLTLFLLFSTSTFVFNLQRRNYSDHVSGCLMFNAAFVRDLFRNIIFDLRQNY